MNMLILMGLALIGILIPIWFVISLVLFIKDRKNKTKPRSTGIYVNFILACVFIGIWLVFIIIGLLLFALVSAFFASM